ncbi:MAG: cytochrome C6 [Leptolyngbya sp. SIO3F4]|nr:cytochrome C6 [Leptolyngbya sp. SIO3F4]
MSANVSKVKLSFSSVLAHFSISLTLSKSLKWLLVCCLVVSLWLSSTIMVWAETDSQPLAAELFEIHCAGCHPNGANIIRRGKNLKQKALKRNGYTSVDEIATLITNGKGLMSAYGEKMSEDDINILASYVLEKASTNWQPVK